MKDLFAPNGIALLEHLDAPAPYLARIGSLRRLIDVLDEEVHLFERLVRGKLVANSQYGAVQTIPGIGPVLGAVFIAEIGDVHRFAGPAQLASWAGLTPKHRESDTHVHRGRITKQGSTLVRWAAVESVKALGPATGAGVTKVRVADRRGKNIGTVAASRRQVEYVYYAMRDRHVRALGQRAIAREGVAAGDRRGTLRPRMRVGSAGLGHPGADLGKPANGGRPDSNMETSR